MQTYKDGSHFYTTTAFNEDEIKILNLFIINKVINSIKVDYVMKPYSNNQFTIWVEIKDNRVQLECRANYDKSSFEDWQKVFDLALEKIRGELSQYYLVAKYIRVFLELNYSSVKDAGHAEKK